MPPPDAVPVTLTAAERKILKKRVRRAKTPYRDRVRAQIVLSAARGRIHQTMPAAPGRPVRVEHEYVHSPCSPDWTSRPAKCSPLPRRRRALPRS